MKKKSTFLKQFIVIIFVVFSMSTISSGAFAADSIDFALFDDYNRENLGVTGDGGAYNSPNSMGVEIYWIQMANTKAQIENNALKVTMDKNGWFGEGVAFKDPKYKYIIMKVKGEKGGEEKLLSLNPDAKGLKSFTDLKGPDGNPLPAITKDYQNIVIDIEKSGFTLPDGFEALHFNNTGVLTIYIDEIYLSKSGVPVDLAKAIISGNESEAGDNTEDSSAAVSGDYDSSFESSGISESSGLSESISNSDSGTRITTASVDSNVSSDSLSTSTMSASRKSPSNKKPVLISLIIFIMALLIAGVVYNSFIRKPGSGK